jgi:hypothetical protein
MADTHMHSKGKRLQTVYRILYATDEAVCTDWIAFFCNHGTIVQQYKQEKLSAEVQLYAVALWPHVGRISAAYTE